MMLGHILHPTVALFLDFDGTLVDIAPRPEAVRVDAALPGRLAAARDRLDGALAILSGRPIADIDRLLAPLRLTAAGVHGLEVRTDPAGPVAAAAGATTALAAVRAALAAAGLPGAGIHIEDKRVAIAVHYRDAPERGADVLALMAEAIAPHPGLHLVTGKMVVEVKPAGVDKGTALLNFLARPPFLHRVPVMIGDDVTDEDAFRAALAAGGRAIKVGPGDSLAPERLPDVVAVHALVATLAG
jgi:trehalose 6-phosphate phosphatase